MKKANELLQDAASIMVERGKQYDKPDGERSMGKTVQMFNICTGRDLRESEGWLLLELLKDVRNFTGKNHHEDSLLDGIAYSALKAEAAFGEMATGIDLAAPGGDVTAVSKTLNRAFVDAVKFGTGIQHISLKDTFIPSSSASAEEDGWIEWKGGECPVAGPTFVEILLRTGKTGEGRGYVFRWDHRSDDLKSDDIIAYRVTK